MLKTRETAELLVNYLIKTKNLKNFVFMLSDESSWYGRFGRSNRKLFINSICELLEKNNT